MGIMRRLGYGIFPIASRRHQPQDHWGQFHKFPHMYTPDESTVIIVSWIATPILAAILPAITGKYDFFNWLFAFVVLDLVILWSIKSS